MEEKINWDKVSRFEENPQIIEDVKNIPYTEIQKVIVNTLTNIKPFFNEHTKRTIYNENKIFNQYYLENKPYSIRINLFFYEYDDNKYNVKIEFSNEKLEDSITLASITKKDSEFDNVINKFIKENF